MTTKEKELAWPLETGDIPTQTLKVGIPKVNRQEMVTLTHRKLRRKGQTRANSEQDSSSTRKPDAVSPEMENMRFSNHRYMGKICQCSQKKLGTSALDATFSIESYKTNVLIWRMFMASSMKAVTHLGPDFLRNSGIYSNTRFENIENAFNITRKLIKEHSEEILKVRGLEYSSPSWTKSVLANDQAVKWAKANVVSARTPFFVLVGWNKVPRAAERRWKGQVEDLRMYSSHQDAVGIHGEAIEFEWTFFPQFSTLSSFQEIPKDLAEKNIEPENFRTESSSCQCSMTCFGKQVMRIASRTLRKSRITRKKSYQDMGHFCVQGRKRDGKAILTIKKDSGIAQPKKRYRDSRKQVTLFSQVPLL